MNSHSVSCPLCNAAVRYIFTNHGRDFYACGDCKLEFIHPQPSKDEISSMYDRNYYDSWGLERSDNSTEGMKKATFHDKLDTMETLMPSKGKILDIGCATGFFLDVARTRGWEPYGVEISAYSSEIARKRFGCDRIFSGQLEEACFADGFFDAVVMTDVLEHVCDVRPFMAEVARILKHGGITAITTPNPSSISCWLMGRHWPHYKLEHLMYYSRCSLALLMEPIGFSNLHSVAATKSLTLSYMDLQLRTYPVPVFTALVSLLVRLLPKSVLNINIRIYSGELFQISQFALVNAP